MKKIFLIMLFPFVLSGQNTDLSFGARMFNPSIINPAAAGLINNGHSGVFVENHSKFVGLEGAPSISSVGYNGRILSDQIGIGVNLINDEVGAISQYKFATDLSYKIKASNQLTISFGLKGGVSQNTFETSRVEILNPGDAMAIDQFNNNLIYDLGIGIFIYSEDFFIEAALPLLTNEDLFSTNVESELKLRTGYLYSSFGFKFSDNRGFQIIPSVAFYKSKYSALIKEVSLMTLIPNYFFGLSYRFESHFSILAGVNLFDSLSVGYTYENIVSNMVSASRSSHGIFLKLNFGSLKPVNVNLVSPRF